MILPIWKIRCSAILTGLACVSGLSAAASAEPPPPSLQVAALSTVETAARDALIAHKSGLSNSKVEDFYAQRLYNPQSQFVNADDSKLMLALKSNDYGFLLTYYQSRCKVTDTTSPTAINDFLDHGAGVGNCDNLAQLYQAGLGVPVNLPQALADYQIAADGGYWPSVQRLAAFYITGKGVPKDIPRGIGLLVRYTTNPKTPAAYVCLGAKALGDLYREGLSVSKSGPDAIKWYQYCLDHSVVYERTPRWLTLRTMTVFADMSGDSAGPAADPAQAAMLYQRILGYGNDVDRVDTYNAQFHMGQLDIAGSSIARDVKKGIELLTVAANAGNNSEAALIVAKLYMTGEAIPADPILAKKYLLQAANARNAEAQYLMGEQALNQPTPDINEGKSWLQSAAAMGYGKGQFALGELFLKASDPNVAAVYAYVWFYFAAQNHDDRAAKARDGLEAKLTPDQMAQARSVEAHLEEQFPNI